VLSTARLIALDALCCSANMLKRPSKSSTFPTSRPTTDQVHVSNQLVTVGEWPAPMKIRHASSMVPLPLSVCLLGENLVRCLLKISDLSGPDRLL
jgi:hypothetical protein